MPSKMILRRSQNDPKTIPKSSQTYPKTIPTLSKNDPTTIQTLSQNERHLGKNHPQERQVDPEQRKSASVREACFEYVWNIFLVNYDFRLMSGRFFETQNTRNEIL